MDDPLVFVNLYSDVGISLTRDSPRLDEFTFELIFRWMVTPLSCGHIWDRNGIWHWWILLFLPFSHWLIVELTVLFLLLVVAHIKCVTAHAIITHLILDHAVVVCGTLAKFWLLEPIGGIIIVNIMRDVFGIRPWLMFKLLFVVLLLGIALFTIRIVI